MFADNAPCHPNINLQHVMLVFQPANTTSVVQSMDQRIIQSMKLKFYQQQNQHIINRMEQTTLSGTALLKELSVLDTIYLINRAWKAVNVSTIMKCFDKCGCERLRLSSVHAESECDSDDDIQLFKLAHTKGVYGGNIPKVISEPGDILTCDNRKTNLDLPATELLNHKMDSGSDSEAEGD